MIPYGRQEISREDIETVIEILKSDWLTQGPMVPAFEQTLAQKMNAMFAVAVNSATSALHIACLALDLRHGDWLWTSPNTFVASANCGLYCGAHVDFVDIDPLTYNMSVESLAVKLDQAEKIGALPKVVIPVHFAGQSCDMESIHHLSKRYGFKIIEDASHAIGGLYKGKPIGSCEYSDITVFSFHPVKVITSGEGGMALTNQVFLAEKMQSLRSHGITRNSEKMQYRPHGGWYYEQIDLGFNYRMTDIQAALGLSQLKRLEQFVKRRHQIASKYNNALRSLPLILPFQRQDVYSAFHLYVIQVDQEQSPINRDVLFNRLREEEIGVNVHYIPVHTQPYYQQRNFKKNQFIEAEKYYSNALSLPIFSALADDAQQKIISVLEKALQK
ncbi:MAG: UDP-4-amino-4,6-dideoxy-N-acetyl-beta-L-altrosamine transaminase [Gammaproteobacteria bacterium RIFCSPHIGHO2_12_FULL_38_11]|nr:MAG: UDP-4-amino-4,6-dideoxy-N-acetyl-beta-L-altrosamine transaminase [Gammaproteobacteria bacterium RIFCSPHIGHO2_12_FULL_38_11]